MFSVQPNGASPMGLNIHETRYGANGRIWQSGKMYPIRNAVVSANAMSFIVPGLDISWSATRSAEGKWMGSWTTKDGEVPSVMGFTNPPDLDGKTFVTLADGRQMYLDCRGSGSPAVIFDAGAGAAAWPGRPFSMKLGRRRWRAHMIGQVTVLAIHGHCRWIPRLWRMTWMR